MQKTKIFTGDLSGLLKETTWKRNGSEYIPTTKKTGTINKNLSVQKIKVLKDEQAIILARKDQSIERYDFKNDELLLTDSYAPETETNANFQVVGLDCIGQKLFSCESKGRLSILDINDLNNESGTTHTFPVQDKCFLQQMKIFGNKICIGGEESDLQIYDANNLEKAEFTAKNVQHDFLDMRVPISVSCASFINNENVVSTGSRHAFCRLYDTRVKRRPLFSVQVGDAPHKAMTILDDSNIILTDNVGNVSCFDLKSQKVAWKLSGIPGAVTDCVVSNGLLFSTCLDRFLRVHRIDNRKLLTKVYLKQQLSCIALYNDYSKDGNEDSDEDEEVWNMIRTVKRSKKENKD